MNAHYFTTAFVCNYTIPFCSVRHKLQRFCYLDNFVKRRPAYRNE